MGTGISLHSDSMFLFIIIIIVIITIINMTYMCVHSWWLPTTVSSGWAYSLETSSHLVHTACLCPGEKILYLLDLWPWKNNRDFIFVFQTLIFEWEEKVWNLTSFESENLYYWCFKIVSEASGSHTQFGNSSQICRRRWLSVLYKSWQHRVLVAWICDCVVLSPLSLFLFIKSHRAFVGVLCGKLRDLIRFLSSQKKKKKAHHVSRQCFHLSLKALPFLV